jgi:Flp pilus assembly CpaE family ATPase
MMMMMMMMMVVMATVTMVRTGKEKMKTLKESNENVKLPPLLLHSKYYIV